MFQQYNTLHYVAKYANFLYWNNQMTYYFCQNMQYGETVLCVEHYIPQCSALKFIFNFQCDE